MVAKIIAWGRDRSEALARLRTALRETTVVLGGGTTTKSFLLELLDRDEVIDATADTGWLDRTGIGTATGPTRVADVALLAAAIDVYDSDEARERSNFIASARGGRPRASHAIGRTIELSYQGQPYKFVVGQTGPHSYHVEGDSAPIDVSVDRLGEYQSRLTIGGTRHHVVSVAGPAYHLVEVDGISHKISQDEAGVVRAPAPAVVVSVPVAVGDKVEAGSILVVLESMKMETAIRAPHTGTVREVLATVNSQVDAGAALLRVDEDSEESSASTAARVEFPERVVPSAEDIDVHAEALERLADLSAVVIGYDVNASRTKALLVEYETLRDRLPCNNDELVQAELGLLSCFADICELSRNRPAVGEDDTDERVHSPREHFYTYLHSIDADREGLSDSFRDKLARALLHYDVADFERTAELEEAVYRIFLAQQRIENQIPVVATLLQRWLTKSTVTESSSDELEDVLDRLVVATQGRFPALGDVARNLRYRVFDEPRVRATRAQILDSVRGNLAYLAERPDAADYHQRIETLVSTPESLHELLAHKVFHSERDLGTLLEVVTRRHYGIRDFTNVKLTDSLGHPIVTGRFELRGDGLNLISTATTHANLTACLDEIEDAAATVSDPASLVLDLYLAWDDAPADSDDLSQALHQALFERELLARSRRVTVSVFDHTGESLRTITFRPGDDGPAEDLSIRDIHPLIGQRLDIWRLSNFNGTRLPAAADTYLLHLVAKENPADERLIAFAEIHDATPQLDEGVVAGFPSIERTLAACLDGIRSANSARGRKRRLDANRVVLYVWPTLELTTRELKVLAGNVAPLTVGAGLEQIILMTRLAQHGNEPRDVTVRFDYRSGAGVSVVITEPPTEPMAPLDSYTQKVQRSRARGTVYPYELIPLLTGANGRFVEHDLEGDVLVPVERPYGRNTAGIITGVVTTPTALYPEGMTRVVLFGDPTKALGSVAEPEAARIVAGINLAEKLGVPVEWFALSSGAEISMERGTENMDWVSRGLRRIITFTQAGGEINIIVAGITVGAQPYWNAEATMLMHTKGILVMTPDSAMVLTGKNSLDYAGGVSAEDNYGIGGYDRVMGPNGQAQYWAPNMATAVEVLFDHYAHSYIAAGERFPRRAPSNDPIDRDIRSYPHVHPASDFTTVGDIFSAETNPDRKKPFDIRSVMRSVVDQDYGVLERWADMADADTSVVFDAHLGGYPVSVIGIESRAIARKGQFPADGPDQWTSGTLFPKSSKKTARAINAASGNRPVVVLANLSGFDGSPESMRTWQLEYGAEIGRAIVNFDGPIVFCVISRYHGGAFVVFSGALNENMEVLAVEGSFASVLGGAPAAAVVFTRDVNARTDADPAVRKLEDEIAAVTDEAEKDRLRVELEALRLAVRSDKLGEVAAEFEAIHNIDRAQRVGSVDRIIPAASLRAELIASVERGIART
ncbi:MAG: fused acetyl/propionyl-CoA carboxylase subunit alpha/methylmalonyl-CoA decarboxylase subunit alpha, partial [Rhodococcus sp.]|nr:fused acetyl/propionyl-CoA carboxylase subunit alpha/methylmalonyl-CoA decarboxylase subunit alpha [Rhodococcus sp. (in: high G+C Gram-positive bacteria)]